MTSSNRIRASDAEYLAWSNLAEPTDRVGRPGTQPGPPL